MTEFAVGAAAMSLLLLAVLALGSFQEVDRRGVLAARHAAWQQDWSPDGMAPDARARLLHQVHLADNGARDPAGRRLLVAEDDLSLESGAVSPSGVAGTATQTLLSPLRTVSGFLGAGFDLSDGGLARGLVEVRIVPVDSLPEPFRSMELRLQAPYALLGDAWHAAGVPHVRQRAGGLVPASRLAALNAIWQPLSIPLGILEPSLRKLCFGLIEPDRIPEDRLGAGHTALPEACL